MTQQVLLLGVDMDLSPATQAMLSLTRSWLLELAPQGRALLLTVITVPFDAPSALGRFRGQTPCLSATSFQRSEARHTLQRAQEVLVQGGIAPGRLEVQVCEGAPAEELVRVASERQVSCIMLGYRGAALSQRLRRLLLGSTSAQILRRAPCPVLLVPRAPSPADLVAWFEDVLTRELSAGVAGLCIFTPEEVASRLAPLHGTSVSRKEVAAATEALLHLADKGMLICQQVKGSWRCFND
jgi:nucleotide-binding universal stress UspA family protein